MKYSRPISLPLRMKKTCTQASPSGARHGDHIRIDVLGGDHLLVLDHPLDGLDLVAEGGGVLEAQLLGGLFHLALQAGDDRLGAPLQELAQVVDHLAVAGLV